MADDRADHRRSRRPTCGSRLALALDVDDLVAAAAPGPGAAAVVRGGQGRASSCSAPPAPTPSSRWSTSATRSSSTSSCYDIPTTVARRPGCSARSAPRYLTMHAFGGADMLRPASRAFARAPRAPACPSPPPSPSPCSPATATPPPHILPKRVRVAARGRLRRPRLRGRPTCAEAKRLGPAPHRRRPRHPPRRRRRPRPGPRRHARGGRRRRRRPARDRPRGHRRRTDPWPPAARRAVAVGRCAPAGADRRQRSRGRSGRSG